VGTAEMGSTCSKNARCKDGERRWERRRERRLPADGSVDGGRKQPELASPMALVDERGGGAQIRGFDESGEWVVFGNDDGL
jgi:hypothetical protein